MKMVELPADPNPAIDPSRLFRMPWTPADNSLSWLEPTRKCNITCDACFAANDPRSEKSLDEIEADLETILRQRKCDGILIAGGEPLTHPRIAEVVRLVRRRRLKPVLVTNGVGLDRDLLRELKSAGAAGFSFHVDRHQARPGWAGKSEVELNELRRQFADLLHREKGLTCAFTATIFPDTLADVPAIAAWVARNIDRVNAFTFTCVRLFSSDEPFDYFAAGRPVDLAETIYHTEVPYRNLTSAELLREVKRALPDFELCAYLGGTILPHAVKWAVGTRVGTLRRSYGSIGPKAMELIQNGHHALKGRFLSFAPPGSARKGRLLFLLSPWDRGIRRIMKRYLGSSFRRPADLVRRLHIQNIIVEQPIDVLETGEQDHCDGCPNKTPWRGRLISACALEPYIRFGAPITALPRTRSKNGAALDAAPAIKPDQGVNA
jgi:hypothetical protein